MNTIISRGKAWFCVLMVVSLNACTTLAAIHKADNITWSTPYLKQADCPNLDGTYEDKGKLSTFLVRLVANLFRSNEERTYEFTEYRRTPHAERYLTKTINGVSIRTTQFANPGDYELYKREEEAFFHKTVLEIKSTSPYVMETISADKNGIRYGKSIYRFEKMSLRFTVGCYQGAFVIRNVNIASGEHTPAARMQANETHFRRLSNGDLQVIDTERTWSPASEAPRTKTTTEVFKLYRLN